MIIDQSRGVWARARVPTLLIAAVMLATGPADAGGAARRKPAHHRAGAGARHKAKRSVHPVSQKTGAVPSAGTMPGRPRHWHPVLALAFQTAGPRKPGR